MIDEFFKFHVEMDYVIRSKQVLDGRYISYIFLEDSLEKHAMGV